MDPPILQPCIICKKNNDEVPGVKKYKSQDTVRNAAERRRSLSRDSFATATQDITSMESSNDMYYHTSCHSRFCAVKRKADDEVEEAKCPSQTSMRSKSDLPQSDKKGVLVHCCIFCSIIRKRIKSCSGNRSFEKLHKVETVESSSVLVNAAKRNMGLRNSQRILSLGSEDLVAIEAHYHNSCRLKFLRETNEFEEAGVEIGMGISNRKQHEEAFKMFVAYIEKEILLKRIPKYGPKLLDLYKEQYKVTGGADENIDLYTLQTLVTKLKSTFGERLLISKESKKEGSFLYPQGMSFDEAKLLLKNTTIHDEEIRCAAMALRSEILQMEKTKMPTPTSVHTLKQNSPELPPMTTLFFHTLVSGLAPNPGDAAQRKSLSIASDAVFATTRGKVKPWKNTSLGLGLSSMLGSKVAITILNRLSHTISYDECKRLETEIAYTCQSGELETPSGLLLQQMLATGTAWDNYDLNMETLDGKNSLHVTVGIAYQNVTHEQVMVEEAPVTSVVGRPRRRFQGTKKLVPPFYANLKLATFKFECSNQDEFDDNNITYDLVSAKNLYLMWLAKSYYERLPLFNGFYSQFVQDSLPLTVIAYMDPISQPPTRNDVVQETMLRSLKVADENKMHYHPVTYDLAVALKAYSIQALKAPQFDRLIILLGHFHVELAFFGAVGTYISDSGLEYLLTESNILAEGSLNGFIHGKLYNRCTRIHQVSALALEKALFKRFLSTVCEGEHDAIIEAIQVVETEDTEMQCKIAESEDFQKLLSNYEDFFHRCIKNEYGETAAFWALYIYLINRLYRELQRAVRTNDVNLYIQVLPFLIETFFSLNRPNYARWGSLFLEKLKHMDPIALDILKAGAFSTRRTTKAYSRSPIDLTLEQTVNRDAASSATGITSFANSEGAFRRWCVNLTQRSMAVSEMKDMCGIQPGETPANQLRKRRIERDNNDVDKLVDMLNETCNPFAIESPTRLVNIATGKSASLATSTYLLGTLQRGAKLSREFYKECVTDDKRLLKTVKRVKVKNFAAGNMKVKSSKEKKALGAAECVRDAFGYLLSKTDIDINYVLAFPITELPLSLAHTDGTPTKTNKATLTKVLESKQTSQQNDVPTLVNATLFDGGLVLHEVLPRHNASTYGKIVSDIMIKVCSADGDQVHLLLDKYVTPSIKDNERLKRGAEQDSVNQFVITGAEQQQQKKGIELLKDGSFKEALATFLLNEIKKDHYAPIVGRKKVYISHGGKCLKLKVNSLGILEVEEPTEFQGTHEEADTLLAFHVYLTGGNVIVRSSDTDVLVILVGLATKMTENSNIWLDFGSANTRRFINATDISKELEKKQIGLSEALIGFHALTGCDFTSAFYRKGKSIPFTYLENAPSHVTALKSLCSDTMHKSTVTAYICRIYGFKALDNINEARYQSFTKMTCGKKNVQVKKINCSSLPPCENTLTQHLLRVNYVSMMWRRAHTHEPTKNLHPLNFGWIDSGEGKYLPKWFVGKPLPDTLIDNEGLKSAQTDEPSTVSDAELLDDVDSDTELLDDDKMDQGGSESTESEIADFDTDIDYDDHPWSDDSDIECEDDD